MGRCVGFLAVIATFAASLVAAETPSTFNSTTASGSSSANVTESSIRSLAAQSLSCCKILERVLANQVFESGEPYTDSLKSYWSAQESSLQPQCIFSPKTANDVATGLLVLNYAGKAVKGGCPFAVRGGGHTPWAGSANINGGVTIDTQSLSNVKLSEDRKSVSIGPGNRWVDVYQKLDALDLSTSGGRVASVGVGGLTLGGGISFFSPRYGLVCDNVVNFEVALSTGKILNVNATSEPQLFKALKGGSNNFAVVTRIDMKVFPQGKFWGGFLINPIQVKDAFFKLFENFAQSKGYDKFSALIASFSFSPTQGGWTIASDLEYTQSNPPKPNATVFQPFLKLPTVLSTMRVSNLSDFTLEIDTHSPPGGRDLFATATFKNNATIMSNIFDLANNTVQAFANAKNLVFSLSFQPLPQAVISPGFATSNGTGNSLGLSASDGDLVNVLLTVQWSDIKDDDAINSGTRKLFSQIEDTTRQAGAYNPYLYLNYAAEWQRPIDGYGADSKRFLQDVSQKYDPAQIFQNQVTGGFKLATGGAKVIASAGTALPTSVAPAHQPMGYGPR